MKAKETADKLIKKMYKVHSDSVSQITLYFAKQCALITVGEILEELDAECWGLEMDRAFDRQKFWNDVKQEIINFKK